MTTGTEVAVTKLMWALGYHVPENHIAYVRREQLRRRRHARRSRRRAARKRPMRRGDIDALLAGVDREADGSFRVVASKALAGKPVGRIRFFGTRPDDPNDIVPHEDRRELRGYGVFAAWLNHVDAKAINSLDTLVTENGRSFVRHHLIDFGSTLGSGGVAPADYWAGTQYLLEPASTGAPDGGLRLQPSVVAARRVLRVAVDRPAAADERRLRPRRSGSRACRTARSCRRAPTTGSGRRAS